MLETALANTIRQINPNLQLSDAPSAAQYETGSAKDLYPSDQQSKKAPDAVSKNGSNTPLKPQKSVRKKPSA
jgi:hypothetical protein